MAILGDVWTIGPRPGTVHGFRVLGPRMWHWQLPPYKTRTSRESWIQKSCMHGCETSTAPDMTMLQLAKDMLDAVQTQHYPVLRFPQRGAISKVDPVG